MSEKTQSAEMGERRRRREEERARLIARQTGAMPQVPEGDAASGSSGVEAISQTMSRREMRERAATAGRPGGGPAAAQPVSAPVPERQRSRREMRAPTSEQIVAPPVAARPAAPAGRVQPAPSAAAPAAPARGRRPAPGSASGAQRATAPARATPVASAPVVQQAPRSAPPSARAAAVRTQAARAQAEREEAARVQAERLQGQRAIPQRPAHPAEGRPAQGRPAQARPAQGQPSQGQQGQSAMRPQPSTWTQRPTAVPAAGPTSARPTGAPQGGARAPLAQPQASAGVIPRVQPTDTRGPMRRVVLPPAGAQAETGRDIAVPSLQPDDQAPQAGQSRPVWGSTGQPGQAPRSGAGVRREGAQPWVAQPDARSFETGRISSGPVVGRPGGAIGAGPGQASQARPVASGVSSAPAVRQSAFVRADEEPRVGQPFGSVAMSGGVQRLQSQSMRNTPGSALPEAFRDSSVEETQIRPAVPALSPGEDSAEPDVVVPQWGSVSTGSIWSPASSASAPAPTAPQSAPAKVAPAKVAPARVVAPKVEVPDDDEYEDDEDENDDEEAPHHPYTWLQLVVLAFVAFLLGMLVFTVVMQDPGDTVTGSGKPGVVLDDDRSHAHAEGTGV